MNEVSLFRIRLTIVRYVFFTFIGYIIIGLSLAVLPVFIHKQLGFTAIVAGIVISLQYLLTFLCRPYAGSLVDRKGPKPAITMSMMAFAISGILLLATWLFRAHPLQSLVLLVFTRLVTGFGEGMLGASPINWAILVVGDEHTGKTISYNGIASYGGLAIGASLGVIIEDKLALGAIGCLIVILGIAGWFTARQRTGVKSAAHGVRESFLKVFGIVAPYGSALALGGLGFGSISTFITLYYASLGWSGAVWCLSVFSGLFIVGRVAFESAIDKYGGLSTAIACLSVESIGLFVIWQATIPAVALVGAGITGLGFSLLFPALGVMAVKAAPAANRGAALAGYGLFIDVSLGITGPLIGGVAGAFGMHWIYAFAMAIVMLGLALAISLKKKITILADRHSRVNFTDGRNPPPTD